MLGNHDSVTHISCHINLILFEERLKTIDVTYCVVCRYCLAWHHLKNHENTRSPHD